MNINTIKELCLSLIKADTEEEVITILRDTAYWDNPDAWRFYGDYENNYNTMGNQQSRPEAALVEKLINSVDARLMNECLVRGFAPESSAAPQTIRDAVAAFYDDSPNSADAGLIREWPDGKRREVAKGITLAVTGLKSPGYPCFTISDCGEGQTPQMMPNTFLSLTKSNKLRIPYVQGKFNMGGTGVLKFCGRNNLQLIVSRRNPQILNGNCTDPGDLNWGFTIVRREDPEGGRRSSVYTYLAPLNSENNPNRGDILNFYNDVLPIFPERQNAYARTSEWGTLIKLYEYTTKYRTSLFRKGGLLRPIDLLLPVIALPIRLHECRDFGGHGGSYDTTLTGIGVRLEDDRAQNLEFPPDSSLIRVSGEQMTATIYAFKKDKAQTYRKNEGIIFTLNGQTHGHLTTDFFRRTKKVGLSYLSDSILVVVDCSKFSGRAREDLFMNSRDRLSWCELRFEIEHALEELLRHHQGLRALKERRRREELESKLEDSKPLESILESLLKKSPILSSLFLQGNRVSTPFKTSKVQAQEKPFEGHRYPSYFKFKGKEYGTQLCRDCRINQRCRITFETDVVNDYFSRDIDQGEFSIVLLSDNRASSVDSYTINLHNGIATLNLQLPLACHIGDELHFETTVTDRTRIEPFENSFTLLIKEIEDTVPNKKRPRQQPPSDEDGDDRDTPTGIQLPNIIKVYENPEDGKKGWDDVPLGSFDKYSALRIIDQGELVENGNGSDQEIYDFYLNMDNLYLKTELKAGNQEPKITNAQYVYGMVLSGLALLQNEKVKKTTTDSEENETDDERHEVNIEDKVEEFSRAIAPVLLPMINHLGSFDLEDSIVIDTSGEAT